MSDHPTTRKCAFVTLGCKINFYDTQAIREAVRDLGYEETTPGPDTDLLVVNSCTVTEKAGQKSVAAVRRLSRRHPDARILVTGCLSEEDRKTLETMPGVDDVLGNEEKDQIPAILQGEPLQPIRDRRARNILSLSASGYSGQTRAYLKIHDGCDDFCTYCIIPLVRGKSKSRPLADVMAEATRFAASGHRELVLTGIHLSRYGRDLPDRQGLVPLLQALRTIPGVERVRLSSIGEGAFSEEFVAAFRDDPGLCRFFHMPLQSGADPVLRRMRRDYTAQEYREAVARVRAVLPDAVIATDLMVGFPGETDEDFEASLDLCAEARFAKIHIFPYSPRSGTKAAGFPDRVPPAVVRERLGRARRLEAALIEEERSAWVGRTVQVLVERQHDGWARGLTRQGLPCRFRIGPRNVWNQEVDVMVESTSGVDLIGVPA